jgi:hypothetical protein
MKVASNLDLGLFGLGVKPQLSQILPRRKK